MYRDTLAEQAEQGVDYFMIHAGVLLMSPSIACKIIQSLAHHREILRTGMNRRLWHPMIYPSQLAMVFNQVLC